MNRSIFLSLKDDNFWGNNNNNNSGDESEEDEEQEETKSAESKDQTMEMEEEKEDEEDEDLKTEPEEKRQDDGREKATELLSTPQRLAPPPTVPSAPKEKKNPFLRLKTVAGCGGFGGFSKPNAASYNNGPPTTPKGQGNPFKPKLSSGDWPPPPTGEPPVFHAPTLKSHQQQAAVVLSPAEEALSQVATNGYRLMKTLGLEKEARVDCGSPCRAMNPKWYSHHNPGPEAYSRKVFVGGLPSDVDEDCPGGLQEIFEEFGKVRLDWPNRMENGASRGYLFLIYQEEEGVKKLIRGCKHEDEKAFLRFNHQNRFYKVQIRAWLLADSDYLAHVDSAVDSKKTIFVGGIPRPLRALELAHIMENLYGPVLAAGIDICVDYKYPKGAGRVVFERLYSYRRAILDRYTLLSHGEVQKRVELKPYILDEMPCEECRLPVIAAPYFCTHEQCLQYYCDKCWDQIHRHSNEEHKAYLV